LVAAMTIDLARVVRPSPGFVFLILAFEEFWFCATFVEVIAA